MIELLTTICVVGFLLSSGRRLGLGNPFQLYFAVWSSVFIGYILSRNAFLPMPGEAVALLLLAKLGSFVVLVATVATSKALVGGHGSSQSHALEVNESLVWITLLSVVLGLPLAYVRAVQLAGADIFTVLGYIQLRSALTDGQQDFGLISYLSMPSFVVSSLCVTQYALHRRGFLRMILAVTASLFFVYLSTGRTFVLLLLVMVFAPLVLLKKIRFKGVFVALSVAILLFLAVATMTSKGVSLEEDFRSNVKSFSDSLGGYTIAPVVAFSGMSLEESTAPFGQSIFRFFFAVFYSLGLTDSPPISLVREYAFVPGPTNVYTVYEVYWTDLSYFGMLVPSVFLVGHWLLYRSASRGSGISIFLCSASYYPLIMHFFQDQYVSLISQWLQLVFWYWLLLVARIPRFSCSRFNSFRALT
jgi:oligosaccharide repeat unit polymerase